MKSKLIFFLMFFLFSTSIWSQVRISLKSLVDEFIYNTDEYKNLQKVYKIQTEEYFITKNSLLPKVVLDINAPTYDHSITVVTQPNGDDIFIDRRQANSSFVFNIVQPISFTGGYLNVKSSFNRIDLLSSDRVNYSSNWFNAAFVQPLNGFNEYKWIKKLNEAKAKSSLIEFQREVEDLRIDLIEKYFKLLILDYKIKLTEKNLELRNKKIINTQLLFNAGRVLETELLQEKISINELKISHENLNFEFDINVRDLKNILEIQNSEIVLDTLPEINIIEIDEKLVKERIVEFGINQVFTTKKIEAEKNYYKAKSGRGIQANLELAYGLNSNAFDLNQLFEIPSKREYVNFRISIPILNWNENKRKFIITKEQKEIVENEYKMAMENIDLRVLQVINYMRSLLVQKDLANQNLELTQRNIMLVTSQYELNRVTNNEFEYELFKEEAAYVDYINNVKLVWLNRYELRKIALYDFYDSKDLSK